MSVSLYYTKEDGTEVRLQFDEEQRELDLSSQRISVIDLSPLSAWTNLKILWLTADVILHGEHPRAEALHAAGIRWSS
jgi:hypothetical protein